MAKDKDFVPDSVGDEFQTLDPPVMEHHVSEAFLDKIRDCLLSGMNHFSPNPQGSDYMCVFCRGEGNSGVHDSVRHQECEAEVLLKEISRIECQVEAPRADDDEAFGGKPQVEAGTLREAEREQ